MGQTEIVIALGGALGAVLRYSSSLFFGLHLPNKPYISTLLVNVFGSLLIGLFYYLSELFDVKEAFRLFFVVGFLGSLTTFSAFSYEFMNMVNEKSFLLAANYIILNISLSGLCILIFIRFLKH
ncbi:MAG: fluoride efflux transporter CrcB [Spirochaetales bacterium]|nr:fluoride efflux transporter CrcB [Spirochaetales bacterium]|tara:strand:- start:847 stop:1218 length:372 start_codon:yes stop_codon:yes gene_type:complete